MKEKTALSRLSNIFFNCKGCREWFCYCGIDYANIANYIIIFRSFCLHVLLLFSITDSILHLPLLLCL